MKADMVDNKKEIQKVEAYSDVRCNRQYLIVIECPICKGTHTFFAGPVGEKLEDWCKDVSPPCDPSARFHVEWNGKFFSGMELSTLRWQRQRLQKIDPPVQKPPTSREINIEEWPRKKTR